MKTTTLLLLGLVVISTLLIAGCTQQAAGATNPTTDNSKTCRYDRDSQQSTRHNPCGCSGKDPLLLRK